MKEASGEDMGDMLRKVRSEKRTAVQPPPSRGGERERRSGLRRLLVVTLFAALALSGCGAAGDRPSSWQGRWQRHAVLTVNDLSAWGVETAEIVFEGAGGPGVPVTLRLLVAAHLLGDRANAAGFLEVRTASSFTMYRLDGQAHRVRAASAAHATMFELWAERVRGTALPLNTWLLVSVNEATGAAEMYIGRTPRFGTTGRPGSGAPVSQGDEHDSRLAAWRRHAASARPLPWDARFGKR